MRKLTITIFVALILALGFSNANAQEDEPVGNAPKFQTAQRPNLLRELNLSKDQVQQLRQILRDKQPLVQQAQRRLRQAQRLLDETIYSDEAGENIVQEKVRELEKAQSDLIRNRADLEFSIRKILTPEQLIKFRELRQNFQNLRNPQQKQTPTNNQRLQRFQKRNL